MFIAYKVIEKVESKFTIVVNKSGVGGDRAGNTYEYSALTAKTLGGRVLTVFSYLCVLASIGVFITGTEISNMLYVLSELSSAALIFLSVVGIPVAILVLIICALLRLKNAIVEIIKEIITGW